jgi:two-component sensor histidine kinase
LAMFVGVMAATALILAAVVTEWKQAEKRRNEAAESALRMKDIAIQEIHHRVKNNLQVVSSLINLQRSNSPGATVEEVFAESQSRIRAIALTYELLHQLQEHQQINFADYVDLLAQEIFRSCELTEKSITVLVGPRKFELELESAIPLGLITNELIRHSCKSIRSQPSQIKVHINNVEKNIHYLFANSESELSDHQSFTSRLIDVLTSQLKGQTNYIDGHGIELHITFPRLLTETVPPRILA